MNIEIQESLDDKPVSKRRKEQLQTLKKFSIDKEKLVVPLLKGSTNFQKDDWSIYSYQTHDFNSIKGYCWMVAWSGPVDWGLL